MFEFLIRKGAIKRTQQFIEKLEPKVNMHIPPDIPLPSLSVLKDYSKTVANINSREEEIASLSDEDLKGKTDYFMNEYEKAVAAEKKVVSDLTDKYHKAAYQEERDDITIKKEAAQNELKIAKKKFLDSILPDAFSVVREAGKRILHMRHYDVQMIGGIVLHNGDIAEMTTGEGKTLVATLPAYLNGLTREGVHIVTVNDYLAKRDREWMGPIFEFLGLSVGVVQHDMMPEERQVEYGSDITYGTNNEFGFDYLRDNMVNEQKDMVQRPHYFSIVDEVDSILVDEARTPLIISGPAEEATDKYYKANQIAKQLNGVRLTENDIIDAKAQGKVVEELSSKTIKISRQSRN